MDSSVGGGGSSLICMGVAAAVGGVDGGVTALPVLGLDGGEGNLGLEWRRWEKDLVGVAPLLAGVGVAESAVGVGELLLLEQLLQLPLRR